MERTLKNSRRMTTLGLSVLACGALVGGAATAQAAGSYASSASAEALTIKIAGTVLTTSSATAALSSAPQASASATEILGPVASSERKVELSSVGSSATEPAPGTKCTGNELTAVPGVRRLDVTCGSATATLSADGGSARGIGAQVVLEPSVSGLLATLGLQEPAQGAVGQVNEQVLAPLVQAVTGTPIGELVGAGTQTVQDVLSKVLTLQATARVVIAPAKAEVSADAATVKAAAHAQGLRIELLPVDGAGATNNLLPDDLKVGEPLVTITVGEAVASKTVDRATGKATTVQTPGAVTVDIASTEVAKALGLPATKLTVPLAESFCVPGLVGTPLETCVTVAKSGVDAKGNPFAEGITVQLFKGLEGGIDIALGRASAWDAPAGPAAAVGAPAVAAPAEAPRGELPRTGAPAIMPLVGGALLGLAALSRRVARRA